MLTCSPKTDPVVKLVFRYIIALRKAGIENFKFHDLRHAFATRLVQRGTDIYKIAKLLGHEDIRMTQRYSHHSPESLRDGVKILEVDFNLTTVNYYISPARTQSPGRFLINICADGWFSYYLLFKECVVH